jgi:hypothetical protein
VSFITVKQCGVPRREPGGELRKITLSAVSEAQNPSDNGEVANISGDLLLLLLGMKGRLLSPQIRDQ